MNVKRDHVKQILTGMLVLGFWMFGFVSSVVAAPGDISTVAGNGTAGSTGDGGPATNASFNQPRGVFVDGSGNIYIVDHVNHRIRKVDTSTDTITTVAGSGPTGAANGGFSGDGLAATSARLKLPEGVFVDAEGNIYIADRDNARIRKVDTSGNISTVVGNGTKTFSGDGGPATSASLNFPRGVFVDGSGNIYIADTSNQRIRKVDTSADTITTVAGNGTPGFSGDDGPATSASLNNPFSVFVDGSGNIYIGDQGNHRIRKVDTSGIISTVAGNDTAGFSGDGGPATSASLNNPFGVSVDGSGNIYIADLSNHVIRKVDTSGNINTVAGDGIAGFSGDGSAATSASLNGPRDVFVDVSGNIYIADNSNNRIRKVEGPAAPPPAPNIALDPVSIDFDTLLVGGLRQDSLTISNTGNDTLRLGTVSKTGPNIAAFSFNPILANLSGTAIVPGGNIKVIANFSPGAVGSKSATLVIPSNDPDAAQDTVSVALTGVAVAPPVPNIAVNPDSVDFGTVQVDGSKSDTLMVSNVGTDTLVLSQATYGGPPFNVSLLGTYPHSIPPGGLSKIIVQFQPSSAGAVSDTVRINSNDPDTPVFEVPLAGEGVAPPPAPGPINTVAGGGTPPDGLGDGGQATDASLGAPGGVFADGAGNIYISDRNNNRIRKVDTSGNISTVAGNGTGAYSGDDGQATSASLFQPEGVFVDGSGVIYIADRLNERVRKIDTLGVITTVAGNGTQTSSGDNGPATSAGLFRPFDVFVHGSGNIYIAEQLGGRIRKVDTLGVITTVAGNGQTAFSGDDGQATSASLFYPSGVFVDGPGSIYIADYFNHRIRKVDTLGVITTVAGSGGTGNANGGFSGDGGLATEARLDHPIGVSGDGLGNIYIAEQYSNRIRMVDTSGIIFTVAGSGTPGLNNGSFSGDDGPATEATMRTPSGVFVDGSGSIYIADRGNNRIRKVGPAAPPPAANIVVDPVSIGFDTVVVGGLRQDSLTITNTGNDTLRLGTVSKTGPNPLAFSFNPILGNLSGTAIVPGGNISVVAIFSPGAPGPKNATLLIPSNDPDAADDTLFVNLAGVGIAAQQDTPNIAVNPDSVNFGTVDVGASKSDTLMVSNTGTDTLVISQATYGGPPFNVSLLGTYPDSIPPGGLSKIIVQFQPASVGAVSDTVRISSNDPDTPVFEVPLTGEGVNVAPPPTPGIITTVAGGGFTFPDIGDGGPATEARLGLPVGVFTDVSGNIYIADRNNQRIRKVNQSGVITTVAGDGFTDPLTGLGRFSGDGGQATDASLNQPHDVFVDGLGVIYIADRINHRIRKVDQSGILTTVAGSGAIGFSGGGFSGDDGQATVASLNHPWGVFVDGSGIIYIADMNNNRIRKVDTSGIITTVAGGGFPASGIGDGGQATDASLNQPMGVFVDTSGVIYIADSFNQRIRKVDTSGIISTVAGNGTQAFSGDDGLATLASLDSPQDVSVDGLGNIYIADQVNHRIRKVDNTSGIISTVAGSGATGFSGGGFSGDDGLATDATLKLPSGVFVDGSGIIYIADFANDRIRKVGPQVTPPAGPNIVVTPPSHDFGTVEAGAFKIDSLMVNNTGNDTLEISGISLAPTALPFGASLIGPARIGPAGMTKIEVRFEPGSVAVSYDTLIINSNDPDTPSLRVPLMGRGVPALAPAGPEIANVAVSRSVVPVGEPVRIFAEVTDPDGVAAVEAMVWDPTDATFVPALVPLFNDGAHFDGDPGDILWGSAPWPTPADRPRQFLVNIEAEDNLGAKSLADSAASFATADPSNFVTLGAGEEIAGPGGQAIIPIFAVGLDDKGVIAGEITLRFDQASVKFLKASPGPGRDFPGSFDFNSPEPGTALIGHFYSCAESQSGTEPDEPGFRSLLSKIAGGARADSPDGKAQCFRTRSSGNCTRL